MLLKQACVYRDIAYFVQNDYDDDNQTILEGVFREMASLSHKFASQYRYVKGYETYTAQRVRRGILDKIWFVFHIRRVKMSRD